MMKSVISLVTGSLMLTAAGMAFAQPAGQQSNSPGVAPPPAGSPTQQQTSDQPSAPNPVTGVVQPPPGPPPEGTAAVIKLPDCAPPNCGTPRIME